MVLFLGDVLILLNENNILKPPIALAIERVKSEFTALRRQNKLIQIGICRCSDRSLFNSITIKHLGSLTWNEFENLSHSEEFYENQKLSSVNVSKKRSNFFFTKRKSMLVQKRSSRPTRDSGFIETDSKYIIIVPTSFQL